MRVVVTGGAGFVGSAIVRELIRRSHQVSVVDDLSTGKRANIPDGCAWYFVDAGRYAYESVDAIIHAAAYPDVSANWRHPRERDLQWERNAELTRRVLDRAPQGCIFILLSTCSVYGSGHVDESATPAATSPYAASKLAAEALVCAYAEAGRIRRAIFRLVNVVGPRYAHGHLADFVRMASEGRLHALDDGMKAKSFVNVRDVAEEVANELEWSVSGKPHPLANLTSPYRWSWRDSVAVMRAMRPEVAFELTWEARRSGWIGDPDELVVSSLMLNARRRHSIVDGVREALLDLGW